MSGSGTSPSANAVSEPFLDRIPLLACIKDLQGRYVFVNREWERALARPRSEWLGKTDYDFWPEEAAAVFHRNDEAAFGSSGPVENVESGRTSGKDTRYWLTVRFPFNRGSEERLVALIAYDITDRRRGEEARRRADRKRQNLLELFRLQIDRMPIAYLQAGPDFHYTDWNPAAERIFGYSKAEVLDKHPFDLIVPPASRPVFEDIFRRLAAGDMTAHSACENTTKEGRVITCEWHNTPLHSAAGSFLGVVSIAQDITERLKLEEQFRQAQKMEAIGRLAGGIAHDFNNLLTGIIGYSDLVLGSLGPGDSLRDPIQEIKRAGELAAKLTNRLLVFSRSQGLKPKVVDLNSVVLDLDKMLHRIIGEDVELATALSPELGRVHADPGQIEQVIMNLVVNARDAMPHGGKLTIETANIEMDQEHAAQHVRAVPGPYVVLAIRDSGIGMDAETKSRMFEPFFTTKAQGKGTGLGLSTVYAIVQQSGGTIWVDSEPGEGATFRIYLPRVKKPAEAVAEAQKPAVRAGSETVLVVEDDPFVRDFSARVMRRQGYTVLIASSGREALKIASEPGCKIHLILTDLVMPQMGGPELARRILAIDPQIKVLYVSGYSENEMNRGGLPDPSANYLQKPFTPDTLARKLRELLDSTAGS